MNSFYQNKKVLITGHTGFKGSWLSLWLHLMGAKVYGLSIDVPSDPSHYKLLNLSSFIKSYRSDIKNLEKIRKQILEIAPDFVFHLAAQPIVNISYKKPIDTWGTNLLGTINILESLRGLDSNCVAVIITSDKCYKNNEWIWGYRENDQLGGDDPYSASKGAAEIAIASYYQSYFKTSENIKIASTRAGNVIGGGDWAPDRIVPDIIKYWQRKEILNLRNPLSTRPWQHVLEPLNGYLRLGKCLHENKVKSGQAFNFGPNSNEEKTVEELVSEISKHLRYENWKVTASENNFSESGLLKLNCDKATRILAWKPLLDFEKTASMTAEWYYNFYEKKHDVYELSKSQIETYSQFIDEE